MAEEERLELVSEVEDEFTEPLERLEDALERVDDAIDDTGRGRDHVQIDVETRGIDEAISELEALDAAIGTVDDDVTIDVDSDFDDVLADDVEIDQRLRGSQFRDTETGQPVSADDIVDRRFEEVSDAINEEFASVGDVDIEASHADIDATTATGVAEDDDSSVDTDDEATTLPEDDDSSVDTDDEATTLPDADDILADIPDESLTNEDIENHQLLDNGSDTDDIVADTVKIDAGSVNVDGATGRGDDGVTDEEVATDGPTDPFDVDPSPSPPPSAAGDGGSDDDLFTIENMDEWVADVEPYFDWEGFGERGGETDRLSDLTDRDLDELVDMEQAVELAIDPDVDTIDGETLRELDSPGVDGTMDAIGSLDDNDATLLGGDGLRKDLRRLKTQVTDFRFTMGAFHNAMASVLPLFGVFVGAIPAAVTAVGALAGAAVIAAGALAGIAGLGAMGIMLSETGELDTQPLIDRLNGVLDTATDAFDPLAQSFAPLLDQTITQVQTMMGPLASASAGLLQFRDDFAVLSSYITSVTPSVVADLLAFSDATMPVLRGMAGFLANTDFLAIFANQLQQALPALSMLTTGLIDILPAIMQLSQGFLVVAGAITFTVGIVGRLLSAFPMLTKMIGVVAGGLLTLVSITTLYTIATSGAIGASLSLAGSLLGNVVPAVSSAIFSLTGYILTTWQAYAATAALVGVLTLGLGVALPAIASQFNVVGKNARSARKELQKFAKTKNGLGGDTLGLGDGGKTGQSSNVYQDNSQTVIYADDRDDAARQQYRSQYEHEMHIESVFGG